jgi:hypothetical protein
MEKISASSLLCSPDTEHVEFLKQRWRNDKTLSAKTDCYLRRGIRIP